LLAVVCLLSLGPAGCGPVKKSSGGRTLVGTWKTDGGAGVAGFTYVFKKDGTMQRAATMGAMSNPENGKWKTVSSKGKTMTILCTFKVGRNLTDEQTRRITFKDNNRITMVLVDSGQQPENYKRVTRR
jgi:hypothetical protein